MVRSLKKLALLPILLLAVTACDPTDGGQALPTSPSASDTPDPFLGALLGGNDVRGYTLVRDPLLPGVLKAVSTGSLIGYNGGTISLLGHTINVPVGAVTKPTLFSIIVLPTGYVEVDLTATLTSLLGPFDVGSKGFKELVPVTLTYERGTNVTNPRAIKVLRIKSLLGYGSYEVMPTTVNLTTKTASTKLDHFSRYTLAMPD